MAYTESSLSRLNKDDFIHIALDMQNLKLDTNSILADIKNKLSELRKGYNKLEADLAVSKSVIEIMRKQIVMQERKSWSHEQYSRRECLEIFGLLSSTEDSQLEGTVLQIFQKMDVKVDPQNVEACHWLKSNNSSKKAIIKLSKRKDADKIPEVKKKLKLLKFESMDINNPIFINDSLCAHYKNL